MEPEETEYLKTTCDNCKQKIEFPEELYDEQIACPTCQANIKAIPDDEKVDPEQDREWLEGGLLEEQQEGIIVEPISEAVKLEMLKVQAETGYSAVFDLVAEKFPSLLTHDGQRRLEEERVCASGHNQKDDAQIRRRGRCYRKTN